MSHTLRDLAPVISAAGAKGASQIATSPADVTWSSIVTNGIVFTDPLFTIPDGRSVRLTAYLSGEIGGSSANSNIAWVDSANNILAGLSSPITVNSLSGPHHYVAEAVVTGPIQVKLRVITGNPTLAASCFVFIRSLHES